MVINTILWLRIILFKYKYMARNIFKESELDKNSTCV